jgi:hypothetical protein
LSCIQTAHRRGHSSIRFPDLIGATARSSIISRHKSSFSATCLIDAIETDGSVSLLTQQLRQRQTEIEQLEADRGL